VKRKLAPKFRTNIKIRPEIIEALRMGAAYHGVGYQTYLQWLVEYALKEEAGYYGWKLPVKKYVVKHRLPDSQRQLLRRLMLHSERKAP
jgi:hypothetical protein